MNRFESRRRALVALLVAATLAVLALVRPTSLDIAIRAGSTRALLDLGFASVAIVFETGQQCPKSNGCTGALL